MLHKSHSFLGVARWEQVSVELRGHLDQGFAHEGHHLLDRRLLLDPERNGEAAQVLPAQLRADLLLQLAMSGLRIGVLADAAARHREHNEALDTVVYAHAVLHGLNMGLRLNEGGGEGGLGASAAGCEGCESDLVGVDGGVARYNK